MLGEAIVLQDWQTIRREGLATFSPVFAQHPDRYAGLEGAKTVEVLVQVTHLTSGITLALETSPAADKLTWRTSSAFTLTGSHCRVLQRESGRTTDFLEDFLRWRISYSGSGDWQACFRIVLIPRA
jgi:hypothetical protein